MKPALGLLGLPALAGAVYALAFFGILPVRTMADKTPALRGPLAALHLVPLKKPLPQAASKPAAPSPQQAALDAQKKQIGADRAQLDKDRAAFEASKAVAQKVAPTADAPATPAPDTAAKLASIYAAMSADDLARLLGGQTDPDAITALVGLGDKKAAKVLAALPPLRASRLARRMAHVSPARTSLASTL